MPVQLNKRLERLESVNSNREKLHFRNVQQIDLLRMKEIFLAAQETGDWSHFYEDLARDAPSAHEAYRSAGWCE